MHVGWGEQKEERQTGTPTQQGVHAIAAQEWARMLGWGMADRRIRISSAPGEDGRAVDDQIASPDQLASDGGQHTQYKESFRQRRSSPLSSFPLLGSTGNAGQPSRPRGKPQASAKAGQSRNQSCISW